MSVDEHPDNRTVKVSKFIKEHAGPATFLFAATVTAVLINAYSEQGRDFSQMLLPTEAFVTGNWADVYPELTKATSPVGWLIAVAPLYAALKPLLGATVAFSVSATVVAVALVVGGMRFAARSLHPQMSDARAWGLSALVLVLPTTVSAWHEFYHPQDVAATGILLFALGFAAQKKWVAAAVLFGGGVLVRQWVALVAVAVSPLAKKKFWVFTGIGVVIVAVGLAPFMLFGNDGFTQVLNPSPAFFIIDQTLLGQLVSAFGVDAPLRYIPLLIAGGAAVYAWVKKLDGRRYLVPLTLVVLVGRQLFELAPLTYYWMPVVALMLLMNNRRSAVVAATVFSFAVWPIGTVRDSGGFLTPTLFLFAGLAAVLIVAFLSDTDPRDNTAGAQLDDTLDGGRRWGRDVIVVAVASLLIVVAGGASLTLRLSGTPDTEEVPLAIGKEVTVGTPTVTPNGDGVLPTVVGQRPSGISDGVAPNGERQLVAFWVHWCGACVDDAPLVVDWATANNVAMSVVVGPIDESKENLPQRVWLMSIPWDNPTVVDSADNAVRAAAGLATSPGYVVVDSNGKIVDAWEGDWDPRLATRALQQQPTSTTGD